MTKIILTKDVIAMVDFENFDVAESLIKSLKECLAYEKGEVRLRTFNHPIVPELPSFQGNEVKEIRESINCSQSIFAAILGVSKKTVLYWESGKNIPNGSAQRLLALLKNKKSDFIKEDLQNIGLQKKEQY